MRVVFTHTDFPLYWPKRLAALHQYLAERNAALHVVELAGKGSPYAFAPRNSVPREMPWTCLFPETRMEDLPPAGAVAALTACLDRLRPDVLIAGALAFPSGIGALRWAKQHGRPIVLFDSVRLEDVPRGPFVTHIKRRFHRHADAAFSAAPSHERPFIEWGLRRESVFYGLEVVDNEQFASIAAATLAQADSFRRELALAPHFFLGVGRFVTKKNWHTLLQAYASFRLHNPASDWRLILVGDGPERSSLQRLAAETGMDNLVTFPGFASQETLARIYALAGALVLPSRYGETWGLVVNEAMACGLPVLVSEQCGCAATLVRPGENGWTFHPDDVTGLSEILARVAALSDTERERMGGRSRQIIADWGLPRFCSGAWEAVQFAMANPLPPPSPLDRLLMSLWKGRYRPT
jgi:glycosyltransferase involved in cell wall biosynthesis